ncbi:hypothetical protein GX51_01079 [Blastomyces parvus]|uniref:BTB domain-containing protein n=1 Tax=Blastomyces parvus TaxID=2060905 RepID=A0A2B7XI10_9EURO|nr:hypothetical protein GX51_01079 [Blastomyces parvus]
MANAIVSDKDKLGKMNQSNSEYTLSESLKSFYTSSKFTDFTIQVADKSFRVHKIVICSHSEYFLRMLNGEWKETAEDVITLKDDPRTIEAMINFMYGFDYTNSYGGHISPMIVFAKLYAAAEFYGIPVLKEQVKTKFTAAARTDWDRDDFPGIIREISTTTLPTDPTLRTILAVTATEHITLLLQKDEFMHALERCGDFAADVVRCLVQNQSSERKEHLYRDSW